MATDKPTKPLEKMSIDELEQLVHKQEGLLKNSALIRRLPDKGQKLQATLETARKILSEKTQFTSKLDSRKINDVLAAIEWRTKPKEEEEEASDDDDDEVVDEEQTLKMIAAGCLPPEKRKTTRKITSDLGGLEAAFLKAVKIDDAVREAPRRPKFIPNALPIERQKAVHKIDKKVEMISLAESVAAHKEAEMRARKDDVRFASSKLKIVPFGGIQKEELGGIVEGPAFSEYREMREEESEEEEDLHKSEDED